MSAPATGVLLVEDDPDYAFLLRRMLSDHDPPLLDIHHVDALSTGLTLLEEGDVEIDVVILDLGLPDSSGIETFHRVNRHAPKIPVVVLSGLTDETLAVTVVREGAQDYLVKGNFEAGLLVRALRYAIERQQLQQHLRNLSLEDDLTGLYNRRGFMALAEQQLKMARRNQTTLLVAFADLDGLKKINDLHGHVVGSEAIAETANLLRQTFRDSDIVARFGGDEFVILLPDADEATFAVPTERLHHHLEVFNQPSARPYQLSLSLGAAAFDPRHPSSLDQLIERADQAMYGIKKEKQQARKQPTD